MLFARFQSTAKKLPLNSVSATAFLSYFPKKIIRFGLPFPRSISRGSNRIISFSFGREKKGKGWVGYLRAIFFKKLLFLLWKINKNKNANTVWFHWRHYFLCRTFDISCFKINYISTNIFFFCFRLCCFRRSPAPAYFLHSPTSTKGWASWLACFVWRDVSKKI